MAATIIRKHLRKGFVVRKHVRKLKRRVITPEQRQLFSILSNQPFEVGGQLKFKKDKLDHAKLHFGNETSTEWEYDPKYNVSFHTHPDIPDSSILPSYDDINSMKYGKEKAQIIFKGDKALAIEESDKFQKVKPKEMKKVSNQLQKAFDSGKSDEQMYKEFKPVLKHELGLDMKLLKTTDKPIILNKVK